MAKFAKVGYGHDGRGLGSTKDDERPGYTYVVNDNVRIGNVLQPIATQHLSKRKFVTTGKVLTLLSQNSELGQEEMANVDNIENLYTGKELGAKGSRVPPKQTALDKHKPLSKYQESTRGLQLVKYAQDHPNFDPYAEKEGYSKNSQETYASYTAPYMKNETEE